MVTWLCLCILVQSSFLLLRFYSFLKLRVPEIEIFLSWWLGLGHAEARRQELPPDLPSGAPDGWPLSLCSSRFIGAALEVEKLELELVLIQEASIACGSFTHLGI